MRFCENNWKIFSYNQNYILTLYLDNNFGEKIKEKKGKGMKEK